MIGPHLQLCPQKNDEEYNLFEDDCVHDSKVKETSLYTLFFWQNDAYNRLNPKEM